MKNLFFAVVAVAVISSISVNAQQKNVEQVQTF